MAQPGPQWASAQPGGPYAPYPGQAGPYSAPRRHSWLTWAIPVAMLVLIGLGLGLGLGLTRGHDHNPPIVTNGTTTTRPATVTTTSEAVTTTSKASTTTTITATGGAGMVDNPLPLGQEAQIGDWKVKVVGATLDATQAVLAALSSNPTPDSGSQYVLVKLEATNTGTGSATYFDAGLWGIIGSKGDLFESSTAWAPDDLYDVGETLPGGTASGNVLFMMDSDQVSGGLVGIADTGNPAQIVFFATTAVTTTTAAEVTTITSALPTYSEVVSTYPPDAALIQTEADILGGDDSGLQLGNIVDLAMVDGQFVYQSYGTKLTVRATITLEGKTYQPGAKLTVDKNLHWIEVSSWD